MVKSSDEFEDGCIAMCGFVV